ncbi:MAG: Cd(II)/Pb(II)-responsive transcriptional regulator [Pseudomonadota bacterium]
MRIGELAKRSHCDVETVRFYEREGLLEAPARESNGYRRYTDAHLVQLNFIRHCRSLDMGLADVHLLRNFQANPALACAEINHLLDRQIDRIHHQVESLRQLEQQLHTLRDSCHSSQAGADCGIMRNLTLAAEGDPCPCHPQELAA